MITQIEIIQIEATQIEGYLYCFYTHTYAVAMMIFLPKSKSFLNWIFRLWKLIFLTFCELKINNVSVASQQLLTILMKFSFIQSYKQQVLIRNRAVSINHLANKLNEAFQELLLEIKYPNILIVKNCFQNCYENGI